MMKYEQQNKRSTWDIYHKFIEWENILTENITEEERYILINILKKICINQNIKKEEFMSNNQQILGTEPVG